MVADRLSLPRTELLNPFITLVSRSVGGAIAADNYGVFNSFNELVIGPTNVGTVLTFVNKIKNYLYLEIDFQGGVAGVTINTPAANVGYVAGVAGVVAGNYTARIPFCGDVESINFDLWNYVVKSIRVYYPSATYSIEQTILAQCNLSDTAGWTYDATLGEYSFTLGVGLVKSVYFTGTLISGYSARIGIRVTCASGLPFSATGYTFFDGVNTFSNNLFSPITAFLDSINADVLANFINYSGDTVILKIKPSVISFTPLVTTFGSSS